VILVVGYDLHAHGRDYPKIEALLKSARSWAHPQGSLWFIDTDREPPWWRDQLKVVGDANDEYFVCRLHNNWATFKVDQPVNEWLKSPARTW
jgi:hypothetical protein